MFGSLLKGLLGTGGAEGHADAGTAYCRWYHEGNVWKTLTYRGVRTLKLPLDAWNYQEIICERGIGHVIETGTRHGGSAMFFADIVASISPSALVVSIDVDAAARAVPEYPGVRFLIGDSGSPEIAELALGALPADRGPLFLILDADHSCAHVLRELEAFVPRLRAGDYLVVEDTVVNGHPVRPDFGPGPWEAVEEFKRRRPGMLLPDVVRERRFGATFAPNGYYVRA